MDDQMFDRLCESLEEAIAHAKEGKKRPRVQNTTDDESNSPSSQ